MKLTPQDIKSLLAEELQKQGSTLEDFEEVLKSGELQKQAFGFADVVAPIKALYGLGGVAGGLTLGAGALAGTGLYAAHKANENSTEKQMKKLKEQQEYMNATRSLQEAFESEKAQLAQ